MTSGARDDSKPVIVIAVFTPVEGRRDELIAAQRATIPAVLEEAGCLLYAIHDAEDGTITMIEKWADQAALDLHATGEPSARMAAAVAPHLAEPVRIVAMSGIAVGVDETRTAL
jgi:quinol monooxygenase YgiN